MSRILMLQTMEGCPGGATGPRTFTYRQGNQYDLADDGPDSLAGVFLREGWAKLVSGTDPNTEPAEALLPSSEPAPVNPVGVPRDSEEPDAGANDVTDAEPDAAGADEPPEGDEEPEGCQHLLQGGPRKGETCGKPIAPLAEDRCRDHHPLLPPLDD